MICPKCQTDNREGRKFCSECGGLLQLLCPSCQAVNQPGEKSCGECGHPLAEPAPEPRAPSPAPARSPGPTSFADGCYQVKKLLGEGGKKPVYLAHDTRLGRDIAFALVKTEGLDHEGRARVTRHARAMGRFGDHPSIIPIPYPGQHQAALYALPSSIAEATSTDPSSVRMRNPGEW